MIILSPLDFEGVQPHFDIEVTGQTVKGPGKPIARIEARRCWWDIEHVIASLKPLLSCIKLAKWRQGLFVRFHAFKGRMSERSMRSMETRIFLNIGCLALVQLRSIKKKGRSAQPRLVRRPFKLLGGLLSRVPRVWRVLRGLITSPRSLRDGRRPHCRHSISRTSRPDWSYSATSTMLPLHCCL